jgi:hypothetical protein
VLPVSPRLLLQKEFALMIAGVWIMLAGSAFGMAATADTPAEATVDVDDAIERAEANAALADGESTPTQRWVEDRMMGVTETSLQAGLGWQNRVARFAYASREELPLTALGSGLEWTGFGVALSGWAWNLRHARRELQNH